MPETIKYGTEISTATKDCKDTSSYNVGDKATMTVQISDQLVRDYADQYGDRNPIHLDESAGQASVFKCRVAHGMLSFNFFSTLLGAVYPGPGTIFVEVKGWKFSAPVKIGDKLSIEVKIDHLRKKSNGSYEITFDSQAINSENKIVMGGQLVVIAPAL